MQSRVVIVQQSSNSFPNVFYLKSWEFVVNILLIIFLICGTAILNHKYGVLSISVYYNFVAACGIILAIIWIILYFFCIDQKLTLIPWKKIEFILNVICSILIFIISIIMLFKYVIKYSQIQNFYLISSTIFGFGVFVLYIAAACLNYKKINGFIVSTFSRSYRSTITTTKYVASV